MSRRISIFGSSFASVIPLLLDLFPNAKAAYSVRKLRDAYSGAAIRVRRSSDNAEQDIGFIGNDLDTVSLLLFVGVGSGFVTTWYDQTTAALDLTQSVLNAQPRIVNAGTIDTVNGKPAPFFDGTNDFIGAANAADWRFLHDGSVHTNFTVAKAGTVADPDSLYVLWGTSATVLNNGGAFIGHDTRPAVRDNQLLHVIGSGVAIPPADTAVVAVNETPVNSTPANQQFLSYLLGLPTLTPLANRSYIASNGAATSNVNTQNGVPSTGNPNHALRLGTAENASGVNVFYLRGNLQEVIFYDNDQSANRTGIESNINGHFNIYP